jgi:hypothetical protein
VLAAASAFAVTADQYLAQKKYLRADSPDISALKMNPPGYMGKVIDLKGIVNGIAKCAGSSSFILDCGGESLLVKAAELPTCVSSGNTIRVLVKLGPGCLAGPSDLVLQSAAYDYDVAKMEKPAPKPEVKKPPAAVVSAPAPSRAMDLASRGGLDGAARIKEIYGAYRNAISKFNRRLTPKQADEITSSLLAFSWHYQVDPRLVVAVILAESHFRPDATSHAGAMGLGQLMPGTARGLGVGNAYDPVQNMAGSIRLIRGHLDKYGNLALALSAYNAGPGAVRKYGGVPPYRETQNYIRRVTSLYKGLCGK